MRLPVKLTSTAAVLALGLAPAALANAPTGAHGNAQNAPGHNRTQPSAGTGSSTTSPPSNAKAFGHLCQSESKKHVAGQKGTAFSKCVTDMAHLANGSKTNPARACANESKKHVAGQKGTPFSQCVSAAAKLQGDQNGQGSGSDDQGSGSGDDSSS